MKISEATILVVDDEPDLLEIFVQWLKLAGCENILSAANGQLALEQAHNAARLDLVVTDVNMPVMDGIALVRGLADRVPSIPSIIFVSGFAEIVLREMYDLGVEAFLSKPLRRSDFIEAIERAIEDRSKLWILPLTPAPRQQVHISAADIHFGQDDKQTAQDSVRLGRGGFTAHCKEPIVIAPATFSCIFPAGDRVMSGHGLVRWRSRTEETLGIEFAFLDPVCREWLLEAIAVAAPRSFIPGAYTLAPPDPAGA